MNIAKIYSDLIITPLEQEIKILKRTNNNKDIILKLQKLLQDYYKKYYNLTQK